MKTLPFALATLALTVTAGQVAADHTSPQGGAAAVSAGASYSSSRGALAFVGFDADNVFGSGLDLGLRFEKGKDGEAAAVRIAKSFELGATRFGADSYLRFSLEGASSNWASNDYSTSGYGLEVAFGASPAEHLTYDLRLFGRHDSFSDIGAGVSPLIVSEAGSTDAVGLGANLEWSSLDDRRLPTSGFRLGADLAWASPLGDREWLAVSVSGGAAIPVASAVTLSLRADAGRIKGLNGQNVTFVDRAFLGSPSPRGFAAAGIGPRDFVAGSVDTPLGGKSYFTSSMELRYQTRNPALSVGAFVDAGALWDLDVVTGGASGTIDDDYHLRTAAGLSVYWETNIGLLQMNLAQALRSEANDEEEVFSLGLSSSF